MELLTLNYLQKIIYYTLFHADASLQRGSSVRRRQSTGGSTTIPRPGGRRRTHTYTIVHDVIFVVSYVKLIFFTCVYLIINLYVSIFTGSPRRSILTHAPAGEMSGSYSGSRSMHVSDEDQDTIGISGKVPHETCTLNEYIFFFELLSTFNLY